MSFAENFAHGTRSSTLALMAFTEFNFGGVYNMARVGIGPLCGEINQGGYTAACEELPPCFAPFRGANYNFDSAWYYASRFNALTNFKENSSALEDTKKNLESLKCTLTEDAMTNLPKFLLYLGRLHVLLAIESNEAYQTYYQETVNYLQEEIIALKGYLQLLQFLPYFKINHEASDSSAPYYDDVLIIKKIRESKLGFDSETRVPTDQDKQKVIELFSSLNKGGDSEKKHFLRVKSAEELQDETVSSVDVLKEKFGDHAFDFQYQQRLCKISNFFYHFKKPDQNSLEENYKAQLSLNATAYYVKWKKLADAFSAGFFNLKSLLFTPQQELLVKGNFPIVFLINDHRSRIYKPFSDSGEYRLKDGAVLNLNEGGHRIVTDTLEHARLIESFLESHNLAEKIEVLIHHPENKITALKRRLNIYIEKTRNMPVWKKILLWFPEIIHLKIKRSKKLALANQFKDNIVEPWEHDIKNSPENTPLELTRIYDCSQYLTQNNALTETTGWLYRHGYRTAGQLGEMIQDAHKLSEEQSKNHHKYVRPAPG